MEQFLQDFRAMLEATLEPWQLEAIRYWVAMCPTHPHPYQCNVELPSGARLAIQRSSMDDAVQMMSGSMWLVRHELGREHAESDNWVC